MTASNAAALTGPQIREIIGCDAYVAGAPNRSMVGIRGTIAYETKSMIIIETKDGAVKQIPKEGARLDVWHADKKMRKDGARVIHGSNILKRPFERACGETA